MLLILLRMVLVRLSALEYRNHLLGLLTVMAKLPLPLKELQVLLQVASIQVQVG